MAAAGWARFREDGFTGLASTASQKRTLQITSQKRREVMYQMYPTDGRSDLVSLAHGSTPMVESATAGRLLPGRNWIESLPAPAPKIRDASWSRKWFEIPLLTGCWR